MKQRNKKASDIKLISLYSNRYKRLSAKMQSFFLGSDTKSACPRLLTYIVHDMHCNNSCCGYDQNVEVGTAQWNQGSIPGCDTTSYRLGISNFP